MANVDYGKLRLVIGFALVIAAGVVAHETQLAQPLEQYLIDREFALLRQGRPQPVPNEVVLIGIDETSLAAVPEPFALWHPYLGRFLAAMAEVKPSVLGMDIALPARSYQELIPQYDETLLAGLGLARGKVPLVLAQTLDERGGFRKIHPPFISMAGADPLGSMVVCPDSDGVVRRYGAALCEDSSQLGLFAAKMAKHLGVDQPWQGWIDYTLGESVTYVPFHQVMQWIETDPGKLHSTFHGKPVLLGMILRFEDRLRLPVPIAALEPLRKRLPGAMLHTQVLRSMLNSGLIQPAPAPLQWALLFAAALLWFGRDWLKTVGLVVLLPGMFALALLMLWKGIYLQTGIAMLTAIAAYAARFAYEAIRGMREKRFLRDVFASYVSPPIMKDILAGRIKTGLGGAREQVTILFSDIRDFTRRSERLPPEESIGLLNEYFSEMTAAVYHCGGTVDKFLGDGMMSIFGAPQKLDCAEKNALEAAQEMLVRLARLNQRLKARGLEEIRMGIGIASGLVVLGHVGSKTRHEYTAIGDTVSTASRLEALTKELGYPILCNAAVAESVGAVGGLTDLGKTPLRGNAAERIYGWNPPILQGPAAVMPAMQK